MAISVNMLRLRLTSDCQPRTKNGQPAHRTTGCREYELDVVRQRRIDPVVALTRWPPHFQNDGGQRQHAADPEPARHVDEVRDWGRCRRRRLRVRAPCRRSGNCRGRSGGSADASGRCRWCLRRRARRHACPWSDISADRRRTSFCSRPSRNNRCGCGSRRGVFGRVRIDGHAADRIEHAALGGSAVIVMMMVVVAVGGGHGAPLICIPWGGI